MGNEPGVKDAATLAAEEAKKKELDAVTEGVRKQLHGEYERKLQEQMDAFKKEVATKFGAAPQQKDEATLIAEEMDAKIKAGTFTARDLVEAQRRIAEITTAHQVSSFNQRTADVNSKIAAYAVKHPEMLALQSEMLEVLNGLPPAEQAYIKNAPVEIGIDHLFNKVALKKAMSGELIVNRDQGGSVSGRSSSAQSDGSIEEKMGDALAKGDRAAFEKHKQELLKRR